MTSKSALKIAASLLLMGLGLPSLAWADPSRPEPRPEARWQRLHDSYVKNAQASGADVLFIGDSITEFWKNQGAQAWAEFFGGFRAVNLGVAGDRVENILWRVRNGELPAPKASPQPRVIVLLAGTNNASKPGDTLDGIASGYAMIVSELRVRLPQATILVMAILPRRNGGMLPVSIPELNHRLAALADGKIVRYVDLRPLFSTNKNHLREDRLRDGLHPNEDGYRAMAQALAPMIQSLLASGPTASAAASPTPSSAIPARARARLAWDAMVRSFGLPNQPGHFYEHLPHAQPLRAVFVWSQSQLAQAALNLMEIDSDPAISAAVRAILDALSEYRLARKGTMAYAAPVHPGPNAGRFWDDNGWIGLAFLQAYAQFDPAQPYLDRAIELFPFFLAGQDKGGGEYWKEDEPQPKLGIPATGSTDQVALRIHLLTGEPARASPYRAFAELNDDWVRRILLRPDGLYNNGWFIHEKDNPTGGPGHLATWMFSYNQGFQIGVQILRYKITGDRSFLDKATSIAQAALKVFSTDRLWTQPPPFNALYFRNLLVLDHYAPNPLYRQSLEQYLDRAWNLARDPATGLFTGGGIGMMGNRFGVIDQAAFVQLLALLCWPPERISLAT